MKFINYSKILSLYKKIKVIYYKNIRKLKFKNPKFFINIISCIIGILGGFSAVILKRLVVFTENKLYHDYNYSLNYWTIFAPAVGILLTVLYVKFFVKMDISHGVAKVFYAISRKKGIINRKIIYSPIISSSLTVGFGGSVGLEAPIVYTGSAIGSNIAKRFNFGYRLRILLVACGVTAAIAGIFKAPIAAIIFSLEVLMIDLSMWSAIPLLISACSSTIVSYFFSGTTVSFSFAVFEPFDSSKIIFYIILGIVCGFFSLCFVRVMRFVESKFLNFKNIYLKSIIGGLVLGILIFIFPPLFGEGYLGLKILMSSDPTDILQNSFFNFSNHQYIKYILIVFLFLVLFIKIIATSITTASGGVGGVFAPALFTGGFLGFIYAKIINFTDFFNVSLSNFTLVGMAGVMSGIMHAPMTSIFLIAEITGGYSLFIPLIITSTIAFLIKNKFDKYSVYTYSQKNNNMMISHNKDHQSVYRIDIKNLIEQNLIYIESNTSLRTFYEDNLNKKTVSNVFVVVENLENKKLKGFILYDEIFEILRNLEKFDNVLISDIAVNPLLRIDIVADDNLMIFNKFDKTKMLYLPVFDNDNFIGIISKNKLLSEYRKNVIYFSEF